MGNSYDAHALYTPSGSVDCCVGVEACEHADEVLQRTGESADHHPGAYPEVSSGSNVVFAVWMMSEDS